MIAWFEGLSLGWGAVVVIGGFVGISLLLARIVARFTRADTLREHNDLTGFIFAVVGVIYAVVLGFVAVGVWERFTGAEDRTFDETSNLAIVYRDARAFPDSAAVRAEMRAYVEDIIHTGLPAMEAGKHSWSSALHAERLYRRIDDNVPRGERQTAIYAQMLSAMRRSMIDRDERLNEDASGLNAVMWSVVFVGGFITLAFTYLFGFRHSAMQTAMIGTLALLIGLVIFLTMSLDYPFRGAIRVGPDAFERAVRVFDQVDAVDRLHTP